MHKRRYVPRASKGTHVVKVLEPHHKVRAKCTKGYRNEGCLFHPPRWVRTFSVRNAPAPSRLNRGRWGHLPNVRSPLIAEGLFPVLCMASVLLLTFQWSQPATTTRTTKQTAGGRNQHIGRGCGPIAKPCIWGQESDQLNTRSTTFTSAGRDFSPLGE